LDEDGVERVVTRSRRLAATERLGVYANAYYARLIECLGESYPALKLAFGDALFDGFAFDYLQRCPSRSYTLGRLGERFPHYLEESRPDRDPSATADQPHRIDWPDLFIDLATLECAIEEVFDGPGVEDQPTLRLEELLEVPVEKRPDIRLRTAPCLRLLRFRYPVNEFYTSLRQGGADVSRPASGETFLALNRRDYVVRRHDLTRVQLELLESLQRGEPIRMAVARAASICELEDDDFAPRLQDWFADWARAQFFLGVGEP
jgi:hypothetical protein